MYTLSREERHACVGSVCNYDSPVTITMVTSTSSVCSSYTHCKLEVYAPWTRCSHLPVSLIREPCNCYLLATHCKAKYLGKENNIYQKQNVYTNIPLAPLWGKYRIRCFSVKPN